jgi:hypothetical protein
MKSKEEKIKELQDTLESVKQELESLKNQKEVLVWEDIDDVRGFDAEWDGTVTAYTQYLNKKERCHTTFKTKEQAEACIALAKISQLLPIYNSEPYNFLEVKHTIDKNYNVWSTDEDVFLLFNSASIAEKFLKHNRRLIRQAKPLL